MYKCVIYELSSRDYYNQDTNNSIDLDIDNEQDLIKIIDISLKNKYSIEILRKEG